MDENLLNEISKQKNRSILVVLTGPTAAGKDTVIAQLVKNDPSIVKVITTTSRKMRDGESEGDPYHFIKREEFEEKIAAGDFFEWVEFRGELYGTQQKTLQDTLAQNKTVIWKIETKGVKNIQEKIRATVPRSVFLYITGDTIEGMKKRVMKNSDDEQAKLRWNEPLVVWELKQYTDADYLIINQDGKLAQAVSQIEAVIQSKRLFIDKNDTLQTSQR